MFEAALNISRRAHRRVDRVRQLARRARAAAARGPRPQGVYATDTPERWLVLSVADRRAVGGDGRCARASRLGRPIPRSAAHAGRRAAHDLLDEKLGAWAAEIDLDKAIDLLRRRGRARRTRVRRPPHARSIRSSSPAATTRTSTTRSSATQRYPSLPFRYASVDHWLRHAGADARPAQPRDPHRPRPLRRRDRRASKPSDQIGTDPARTVRRAMSTDLFDRVAVIDVDTHLTEPPDVWTARVPVGDARRRAAHRAHRRQRRVDGGRRAPRSSRLLLHGRLRRRHAGVDPEDVRRDPRRDVRRRRAPRVPRRAGHPRPGAVPERGRLRERLLPPARRHASSSRSACAPTTTSSTTGAAPIPTGCSRSPRSPFWDVDLADQPSCSAASSSATGR